MSRVVGPLRGLIAVVQQSARHDGVCHYTAADGLHTLSQYYFRLHRVAFGRIHQGCLASHRTIHSSLSALQGPQLSQPRAASEPPQQPPPPSDFHQQFSAPPDIHEQSPPPSSRPAVRTESHGKLVRQRNELAHYLHGCASNSHKALVSGMTEFELFLKTAKRDLEASGSSEMQLDQPIIDNYLKCEDRFITHHYSAGNLTPLEHTLGRLSIIIQNLHFFLIPVGQRTFDEIVRQLFKRYFAVCNVSGRHERAQAAWHSCEGSGQTNVLEDPEIALDYISSLLSRPSAFTGPNENVFLREAVALLLKWNVGNRHSVRPPPPMHPTAGNSIPLHRYVPNDSLVALGDTYRLAARVCLQGSRTDLRIFYQLGHLYTRVHELRQELPHNMRGFLSMGMNVSKHTLLNVARLGGGANMEEQLVERLLFHAMAHLKEDIQTTARLSANRSMPDVPQLPMVLDEGAAVQVLMTCSLYGLSSIGMQVFDTVSKEVMTRPAPPPEISSGRSTILDGKRVPSVLLYHSALHSCCADRRTNPRDIFRRCLQIIARLETDYNPRYLSTGKDLLVLEPTRTLAMLSQRIGYSLKHWQLAWSALEELDFSGATLTPAQLNFFIAALAYLPPDSQFDVAGSKEQPGEKKEKRSVITQAVALHDMIANGFKRDVGVNTFNALLAVFCNSKDKEQALQLILNLLDMMSEKKVEKTSETFRLLLKHWISVRSYGAFLATLEDMEIAGVDLPVPEIIHAFQGAEAGGKIPEATALSDVLQRLGRNFGMHRTAPASDWRPSHDDIDDRGRERQWESRGRVEGQREDGGRSAPMAPSRPAAVKDFGPWIKNA